MLELTKFSVGTCPPPPHQGVRGLMHDDPQSNLAAIIIITDLYQCKFKNTIPEDYILFYLNLYLQVPEHLDQIILKKQILYIIYSCGNGSVPKILDYQFFICSHEPIHLRRLNYLQL
jgi:hypothetical protein